MQKPRNHRFFDHRVSHERVWNRSWREYLFQTPRLLSQTPRLLSATEINPERPQSPFLGNMERPLVSPELPPSGSAILPSALSSSLIRRSLVSPGPSLKS